MNLSTRKISAFAMLLGLALISAGCGGGTTSGSGVQSANSSPVQVRIGDAPADWIMTFSMNVNSIMLTNSSGGTVNVMSSSTPTEMMGLMGTVQPLTTANVPDGTYTQATVSIAPQSIGYMDPNTHQYVQKTLSGTYQGTVTFNPAMTVGSGGSSSSSVLGFDMNMANSVSIDASGNVTITPQFTAVMNPTSAGSQSPWQGSMQSMVGSVSSTSGSQFTVSTMMGQQSTTFNTDSNTQFQGMSGVSGMSSGMIVSVDATTRPDGSLMAQSVSSMEGSGGMMAMGVVGSLTGAPPTQMSMVADNGISGGMGMSNIGGTMTIDLTGSTPYSVDSTGVDLTNLPFTPSFSGSNIALGQKIEVFSSTSMMNGGSGGGMMGGSNSYTVDANQVVLVQQGLHGTVSNYTPNGSQASFTLTLPSDSAFTTLTGATTITVYQQSGTQMFNTPSISNGNTLEVRGLLFNDSGVYKMVASWIVTPAT